MVARLQQELAQPKPRLRQVMLHTHSGHSTINWLAGFSCGVGVSSEGIGFNGFWSTAGTSTGSGMEASPGADAGHGQQTRFFDESGTVIVVVVSAWD